VLPIVLLLFAAAEPLEQDSAFLDGRELYEQLRPAEAIRSFELSLSRSGRTDGEKARLRAWIGLCRGVSGDLEGSRRELELALDLDPMVALPDGAPPKIVGVFDEARAARAPPPAEDPEPTPARGPEAVDVAPPIEPTASDGGALALWGAIGAGVLGGAGVMGLLAGSSYAVDAALLDAEADREDVTQRQALDTIDDARRSAAAANTLLITSGVLAAGSVGLDVFALLAEDL
jgi:hypothetical protein